MELDLDEKPQSNNHEEGCRRRSKNNSKIGKTYAEFF